MTEFISIKVSEKFDTYPLDIKQKLLALRELVYKVVQSEDSIIGFEETLKWNEPSFVSKNGSTLRIDWKKSKPDNYSMYFNCKSRLVETFRELFSDRFEFDGNREITFHKDDLIDVKALKYCILLTLTYHDRKHLAMLDD
jgi:hypothetical protein